MKLNLNKRKMKLTILEQLVNFPHGTWKKKLLLLFFVKKIKLNDAKACRMLNLYGSDDLYRIKFQAGEIRI